MIKKTFLLLLIIPVLCFSNCGTCDLDLPDLIPKLIKTSDVIRIGGTARWEVLTCNLFEDISDSCGILDAAGSITQLVVDFFDMPIATGIKLASELFENGKISPSELVSTNACPFETVGVLFDNTGTYFLQEEVDLEDDVSERAETNNMEDSEVDLGLRESTAESRSIAIKTSSGINVKRFKEIFEGPYSKEFINAFNRSQVVVHIIEAKDEEEGTFTEQLGNKQIYIVKTK